MDQGGFCMWSEGEALYGCNTKNKMGIIICWQVSGSVPVVAIQIPCQHDVEMKGEKQDERRKLLLCDIYVHSFLRMP